MDAATFYEAFYSDFFQYMKRKRIYVSEQQKKNLGDTWMELLREFVGQLVTSREKGGGINSIYDEMCDPFHTVCDKEIQNEDDQLIFVFDTLRYIRNLRKEMEKEKKGGREQENGNGAVERQVSISD